MKLQEQKGMKPLELCQDVVTRWNSEQLMLERLCHLQEPVSEALIHVSTSAGT